jgi:hypothetical protein
VKHGTPYGERWLSVDRGLVIDEACGAGAMLFAFHGRICCPEHPSGLFAVRSSKVGLEMHWRYYPATMVEASPSEPPAHTKESLEGFISLPRAITKGSGSGQEREFS